jgi:hypothetical protein
MDKREDKNLRDKIVEFEFYTYEEFIKLQYVVDDEEEYKKLMQDFKEIVKNLVENELYDDIELELKENGKSFSFSKPLNIKLTDVAYHIDKELERRGYKKPYIFKKHYADLWGNFDFIDVKYQTHENYEDEIDDELLKIFNEVVKEIYDNLSEETKQKIEEIKNKYILKKKL